MLGPRERFQQRLMTVLSIRSFSVRIAAGCSAAILIWLLYAACGSEETKDSPRISAPASENRGRVASDAYDIGVTRASLIASDQDTSEQIKGIVRDHKVEFAEYESAVLSALSCVKASGAHIRDRDPVLNVRGLYTWLMSWPQNVDLSKQTAACFESDLGITDLLWKEHVSPSERDVQTAMQEMAACLQQSGLGDQVPESRLPQDFQRIPRNLALAGNESAIPAYVACARAAQDQFGLIGFIGESIK